MVMEVVMMIILLCDQRKNGFQQVKQVDPTNCCQHLGYVVWKSFMVTIVMLVAAVI